MRSDALVVLGLLVLVGGFAAWWTHQDVNSFTLQTHGDQALIQASTQIAMQSGPFATNPHVGWPSGFNLWAFPPTSSLGFYLGAWFLGVVLTSSGNALALLMGATAAAVAVTSYWALRVVPPRPSSRVVAGLGAFTLGVSPYVLSKLGHFNVAAWYLVPAIIAVLATLQSATDRRRCWGVLAVLSGLALLSPLWWSLSSLYMLLVGVVAAAILRSWDWARRVLLVAGAVGLGTLFPASLALSSRVADGSWNRELWDSTLYGGSLFDLFYASPWMTRLSLGDIEIARAMSREVSHVGVIAGITALVALVAALTAFVGFGDRWKRHRWLFIATQVVLLSFLAMGLGTVQEAVLAIAGLESPLRVWSRMVIVLALLGMIFAIGPVSRWFQRTWKSGVPGRVIGLGAGFIVGVVVVVDTFGIELMTPRTVPDQPETTAVAYLEEAVGDCPVVQLPVGTFPDFPMADGTPESITYYYRGFVPYMLNPDGYWSFGAPAGSESDRFLRSLPTIIDAAGQQELAAQGYCAILYDSEYAAWLERRLGSWHGMKVTEAVPAWENGRFAVFELG